MWKFNTASLRTTDLDKLNLVQIWYGGLVLGSSQFPLLPQLPQNDACLKSGQNWLSINHLASLVKIRNTLCSIATNQHTQERLFFAFFYQEKHFRRKKRTEKLKKDQFFLFHCVFVMKRLEEDDARTMFFGLYFANCNTTFMSR